MMQIKVGLRNCHRCGAPTVCGFLRGRPFCLDMCFEEIRDQITNLQLRVEAYLKDRWM